MASPWASKFRPWPNEAGIVGDDIDKTAFYGSGVIVRSMGQRTKHLADVFSEMYILPVGVAEPA